MDVKCVLPVKEHELLINHTEHAIKASCQDAERNFASPLLEQMGFIIVEFVKWKWKAVAVEWVHPVRCITVTLVYITDSLGLYVHNLDSTHVRHLLCLSWIFVGALLTFLLELWFYGVHKTGSGWLSSVAFKCRIPQPCLSSIQTFIRDISFPFASTLFTVNWNYWCNCWY